MRRHPQIIKITLNIAFFLCGCGQARLTDPSTLKIIGGSPSNDRQLDAVVAIVRDELTICTGTLIADDLVLTAAHCLEKATRPQSTTLASLKIVTGATTTPRTTENTYDIERAAIHPKFWSDYRGAYDFGWIKLTRPVPGISPIQLPETRTHANSLLNAIKSVIIAGYGFSSLSLPTNGEEPKIGMRLQGKTPIKFRTGAELYAGNQDVDACSGDSGGPAFAEVALEKDSGRKLILLGVTSRGPMPCASNYEAGAYGLATESLCWLRSTAKYRINDPVLADFCVRETAQAATTDDDTIVMDNSFLDACQSPHLTEASRHDLMQLFDVANIPADISKDQCMKLKEFLENATTLDLSHRNLHQLAWLRHAKQLTSLVATDNVLRSTRGVEQLDHLNILDVRNNAISSIQSLSRLAKKMQVFGAKTQLKNIDETHYRKIAELGAAAGSDRRTLILTLRDLLAAGEFARKSRDLALKRQINLDDRRLRSIEALMGLENLEAVSAAANPEIKDWEFILTLPRLRSFRYGADEVPGDILKELGTRGVTLVPVHRTHNF